MNFKFSSVATALLLMGVVCISSCKKESSVQSAAVSDDEALIISQENADAESEYDDLTEIGLSAGADLEAASEANTAELPGTVVGARPGFRLDLFADLQWKIGPCTTIEVTPADSSFPKTVTINYGDGCICRDGKFRKGALILYFSGPIRRAGSTLTITLRNFYVNRVHVEGSKTIENLSANAAVKYSVKIENGAITWPNGRGFRVEGAKVFTQVKGMDTRNMRDDVYSIEGRSEVFYANGLTVTRDTETPLIKPVECAWLVQGILKVKINSRVFYIDFANGECDNQATLKWANGEIEIRLP